MSGRVTATQRTPQADAATQVILSVFRANGLLLAAGDLLAGEEQLTAARWQVLGAVALAQAPLTVPQIARRMGLTRQSVHATVKRLEADGLLQLESNADHRRSRLVRLTECGRARYGALAARQARWSNRLAEGLELSALKTTTQTLGELCKRLESELRHTSQSPENMNLRAEEQRP